MPPPGRTHPRAGGSGGLADQYVGSTSVRHRVISAQTSSPGTAQRRCLTRVIGRPSKVVWTVVRCPNAPRHRETGLSAQQPQPHHPHRNSPCHNNIPRHSRKSASYWGRNHASQKIICPCIPAGCNLHSDPPAARAASRTVNLYPWSGLL